MKDTICKEVLDFCMQNCSRTFITIEDFGLLTLTLHQDQALVFDIHLYVISYNCGSLHLLLQWWNILVYFSCFPYLSTRGTKSEV